MKQRSTLIAIVVALGLAVVAFYFLSGEPATDGATANAEGTEVGADGKKAKSGRSILPSKFPGQDDQVAEEKKDPGERARPFKMKVEAEPALSGMAFEAATEEERENAGVPDKFGRGVAVRSLHPDSPGAEVALRPGDVIVRAGRDNIDTPDDLRKTIGNRDHTLVTFARDGQLLEVVLKPPFKPKSETN